MTRCMGAALALLAGALGLVGCGSDCTDCAGSGGTAGVGGLEVAETTPSDLAVDVTPNAEVSATFTQIVRESSVTDASFILRRSDNVELPGLVQLTADGSTAIFTPDEPFGLGITYTALLTSEIESVTGDRLDPAHSWSFTSLDGGWGTARPMQSAQGGNAFAPQVAMSVRGDSIAVWQDGMYGGPIWASRYTQADGWAAGLRINPGVGGNGFAPQVGMDPDGNAVAVWTQASGVWASRYTVMATWSAPVRIDDEQGGGSAQVAVDAAGNAVTVWLQPGGDVWANRFTPDAGWAAAERIESDDAGTARAARVAVDPEGNATAVWERWDGMTSFDIWANRFTPAGGWEVASRINSAEATGAHDPEVAMDPNGEAIAIWWQEVSDSRGIWSNRFTPSGGWRSDERVNSDTEEEANAPQLAVAPNARVVAVWQQSGGIWSSQYSDSDGWGADARIDDESLGMAIAPDLTADASGNAIAVWQQDDGAGFGVWASRLAASDWGVPEPIDAEDGGGTGGPQVAGDAQGHVNAVWLQSNAEGSRVDVWSNRFE